MADDYPAMTVSVSVCQTEEGTCLSVCARARVCMCVCTNVRYTAYAEDVSLVEECYWQL